MFEVRVDHLGDVQFEVRARDHVLYCDQPAENGGYDEGMTPPELFLASLAACAGFYAAEYLKGKRIAPAGLRLRATGEKASSPARIAAIHIEVECPPGLSQKHCEGVVAAVRKCLLHNTLLEPPRIRIDARAQEATLAA